MRVMINACRGPALQLGPGLPPLDNWIKGKRRCAHVHAVGQPASRGAVRTRRTSARALLQAGAAPLRPALELQRVGRRARAQTRVKLQIPLPCMFDTVELVAETISLNERQNGDKSTSAQSEELSSELVLVLLVLLPELLGWFKSVVTSDKTGHMVTSRPVAVLRPRSTLKGTTALVASSHANLKPAHAPLEPWGSGG
eukprot:CAMPEP_0198552320 /NCGR_PEP_ID=MMETSP1462-20131121/78377_1 /TAXON_ID=1333877 /ORGANISM="Brandtodinium nutriculum, Strain RCC3387" /LENGTH=197 /DNA_ID=CAMNT_0044282977 /DNA_START=5 /DNA_END=596 /DNA_ORIENTATION=+